MGQSKTTDHKLFLFEATYFSLELLWSQTYFGCKEQCKPPGLLHVIMPDSTDVRHVSQARFTCNCVVEAFNSARQL